MTTSYALYLLDCWCSLMVQSRGRIVSLRQRHLMPRLCDRQELRLLLRHDRAEPVARLCARLHALNSQREFRAWWDQPRFKSSCQRARPTFTQIPQQRSHLSDNVHILQAQLTRLLVRNDNLSIINSLDNVVRGFSVDGATDGLTCTEDFLDTTSKVLGEGFVGELSGDVVDLVKRDVSRVLDVLLLLSVPWGLWRQCESY